MKVSQSPSFVVVLLQVIWVGSLVAASVGHGFIPESGRSPGGGNGNPLQYACLENPIDREAW